MRIHVINETLIVGEISFFFFFFSFADVDRLQRHRNYDHNREKARIRELRENEMLRGREG